MVDTCVMCGMIVPEGTQVCLRCIHDTSVHTKCPDCTGDLQLMYTSYYHISTGLVRSTLYHCKCCASDWELEIPFVEQSGEFKRKFWG